MCNVSLAIQSTLLIVAFLLVVLCFNAFLLMFAVCDSSDKRYDL